MKLISIILFCILSVISGDQNVDFNRAVNNFNAELYQKIIAGKTGNVVMSPISVQILMSMLYMGATGETEAEIKDGLKYTAGFNKSSVSNYFNSVISEVDSKEALKIANKIYVKNGYSIKPKFSEIVSKKFGSAVENINFCDNVEAASEINEWVESKTNNKIKNLIDPNSLNDATGMILLNAVHFKEGWETVFEEEWTGKSAFYLNDKDTVEVDFMMKTDYNYNYGSLRGLNAHALEMFYRDNDFSMTIILPDSRTGLAELESKLHQVNLDALLGDLDQEAYVTVKMPKFKIESKLNLKEVLQNMGMERISSDRAELGELLDGIGNLKVSDVLQKAFIEVDENGTEAAAASFGGAILRSEPEYFLIDHPFLYLLKYKEHVIFMGRVVNPAA
jgi:serpin B